MAILYALVSRKKVVLAEYTASSGNFPTVTRVLLSKIADNEDSKMSYVYDNHVFHYIIDQGITFLCMSSEDTKRRVAFMFLEDIIRTWRERFLAVEQTAIAFSLNEQFSPVLQQRVDYFSNNPGADNLNKVQAQIEIVKDVMVENIEKVLERGEKIELLVDKTDRLNQQAFKFEKSSRALKSDMLWKKYKLYLLIFVVVILVAFFLSLAICGANYDKCKKHK